MAQNVTVAGASYQDVPSVELPTTGGGTSAFYDVSDTTAAASDVASGKYFYTSAGVRTAGTSSGGGGSVSYYTATATLPTTGWTGNSITVSVAGMTASADVIVAPAPASASEWASCGILCSAQGEGTLTFTRTSANANALTANIMVFSGGVPLVSYDIYNANPDYVSCNKQSAYAGETVTLTNIGNRTRWLSVRQNGGDDQLIDKESVDAGDSWSFTMPAEDVRVTASNIEPS